ncbi:MAG: hypothetical protein PHU53_07470 [Thermoplasmata archaeon]|nr:hypothetical protein [Thermoplasmata archaeon]
MKLDKKFRRKNVFLAVTVCIGLSLLTVLSPIIPCGYCDAASNINAGYGYHSFAKVISEMFEWDSGTVPVISQGYEGSGPYIVTAEYWIVSLYIPMFMAIVFLGWLIMNGEIKTAGLTRLSTKSGKPRG